MKVLEKEGITFPYGTIKPSLNDWLVRQTSYCVDLWCTVTDTTFFS